ncbi:MAG: MFS transporter [Rhodospirillales bacterium]|nr:MFS transporter [Rhodospirillales bacterium]
MAVRRWIILLSLLLARIGFGLQYQTVPSLGPLLMGRFGIDYAGLGSLIGAYMIAGVVVALPMGLLGRRLGDRRVLGGGLALMAAGGVISALGGGADGIAAGRAVAGIGGVAMTVLQAKVIADWFQGRAFMPAIGASVSAYPVGIGLAQIVVPPIARDFGWPAAFLAGAALLAAAALLFVLSYRPVPQSRPVSTRFSFPGARESLLLVIAGLIWTAYTSGYAGYTSYIPSFMAARGAGLAATGLVLTIATWGNVPAILLGGGLAARFGALRIFLFGTAMMVAGMAGTALAGGGIAVLVALAGVVGVVGSIHPGVIMAVGTLSARAENRATGMGIFYTTYYAGGSVAPALCGRAADWYGGPAGALLAAAALSALAVPMYLLHRRMAGHHTMLARA